MPALPNMHFAIAMLLMLTAVFYLLIGFSTLQEDRSSLRRRKYAFACVALALWAAGMACMTISQSPRMVRGFFTIGFVASYLFFPAWISFIADLADFAPKRAGLIRAGLFACSAALIAVCLATDHVTFRSTSMGMQYNFGQSLPHQILFLYSLAMLSLTILLLLRWRNNARLTRLRKQSLIFIILTMIVSPPGLFFDFVIPAFTNGTIVPITTLMVLLVSFHLYFTMRTNTALDINVRNISEHLFRSVTMPVLILDHGSRVVLANNSARMLLAGRFGFFIGCHIGEIVQLEGPHATFETSFDSEIAQIDTWPRPTICDMLFTVIRDDYQDILSKIVVLKDVTALQNTMHDLSVSRDIAEDASRAKSEFLSRMSHEIRTPMNAIIGMTKIGRTTADAEKMQYCMSKIDDASRHLLSLINDILDMSKIEANKLELLSEPFDLERMLERICNVVCVKAEEKKLNLFVRIDEDVPHDVVGDELRLSQVITNLLSNAIKFTPDYGSIHLNVSKREEGDAFVLHVEIQDTGIGISPEQISRLFTSFEQAEGNIARRFGGTGLGLAISRRIVEMMGGEIGVSSEVGRGSCFRFTVRLTRAHKSSATRLDKTLYARLRVLVVDDDPAVLDFFQRALRDLGSAFELCASGEEAVERTQAAVRAGHPFDIAFVDYLMEGMNGIDTVRAIKRVAGDCVKVIMISISNWNTIELEAAEVGVARFILKPLFQSAIVNAINELVLNKEMLAAATPPEAFVQNGLAGKRMLLAEDIEINREITITLLSDTGIQIDCAENGEEALRMFREDQSRYDLILMDVQMPLMDGLEATRRIRGLGTAAALSVPIIALTANAFKEDVETCRAAGMMDHIGKPIDADALLEKVARYACARR